MYTDIYIYVYIVIYLYRFVERACPHCVRARVRVTQCLSKYSSPSQERSKIECPARKR